MTAPIAGVIEGFYGRPWSWEERLEVSRACAGWGMTHYVYAPKDDPLHRQRWREPYGAEALSGFEQLVAGGGLTVGFAISPGLDIDEDDVEDRRRLGAKVDQVVATGVGLVVLALDDLPGRGRTPAENGARHGRLTAWLAGHLTGRADLAMVPVDYTGTRPTPYLEALVVEVPAEVPVGWTGRAVVNDSITAAEARGRTAALGDRPPLLWDNYPVNDAVMADRLFLGPLRGREPALLAACCGYLANAMVQPRCSLPALASIGGWLGGEDPTTAWAGYVDEAGLRTFAEACDGTVPRSLVEDMAATRPESGWPAAVDHLREWLDGARHCAAPGLEAEAGPWLDQVHAEADLARAATRVIALAVPALAGAATSSADRERASLEAFGIALRWPELRRAAVSVLGPRAGVRPVFTQAPDGRWVLGSDALDYDQNATDRLVRLAFEVLDAAEARWATP